MYDKYGVNEVNTTLKEGLYRSCAISPDGTTLICPSATGSNGEIGIFSITGNPDGLIYNKYSVSLVDTISAGAFCCAFYDNVTPIFTTYYDGRKYTLKDGTQVNMTDIPYEIIVSGDNSTLANVMLELNNIIVGWIGYDQTGALRVEASQDDLEDSKKPVLWNFTPENSQLLGITETYKNGEIYNDVIISGQSLESKSVIYGRASNYDARSDTNINLIGRRTYRESQPNYWNETQCNDLAKFRLKRKTVLQKSITIESSQLFHLVENNIVTVKRTDKVGNPTERHLIQSFSLPIGETGAMTINCVSVNDLPNLTITA